MTEKVSAGTVFDHMGVRVVAVKASGCGECAFLNDTKACDSAPSCLGLQFRSVPPDTTTTTTEGEKDPSGLSANQPGAKLDAGKVRVELVLGGFARALNEVAKVGTAGAQKYTPNGWTEVENGIERYDDAGGRHRLARQKGETHSEDLKLLHRAHEAWNALAALDLYLRQQERASKTA